VHLAMHVATRAPHVAKPAASSASDIHSCVRSLVLQLLLQSVQLSAATVPPKQIKRAARIIAFDTSWDLDRCPVRSMESPWFF
jgi:hypothetical protein